MNCVALELQDCGLSLIGDNMKRLCEEDDGVQIIHCHLQIRGRSLKLDVALEG